MFSAQDVIAQAPHRNRHRQEDVASHDRSESQRVRLLLMARLREMMESRGLTQVQAASWFHVSQSRISHLVNDKANRFTTDTLINMLAHAGVHIDLGFQRNTRIPS